MKKTALITGVAGFIGSHLADKLISNGINVIGMDNLCTGDICNIEHILPNKNFQFINYDVTNYLHVSGSVDYILHFASAASPLDYVRLPTETLKVGSVGTINCLELAKEKRSRIILASTSEVYGDPLEHPQKESYWGNVNSVGERSMYDEAKRFLEAVTMAYHNTHKVNTGIVRIFNTFGERMRVKDGRAIPAFFSQALLKEDITITGDGEQTRSFCYVDDTVEGIFRLMLNEYNMPVNIGNPEEITLNQLADEIIELTATKSNKIFIPLPPDDPKRRMPDISVAKTVLGWQPVVPRSYALIRTHQYFKQKLC